MIRAPCMRAAPCLYPQSGSSQLSWLYPPTRTPQDFCRFPELVPSNAIHYAALQNDPNAERKGKERDALHRSGDWLCRLECCNQAQWSVSYLLAPLGSCPTAPCPSRASMDQRRSPLGEDNPCYNEHLPLMVDQDKSAPANYAMLSRRHDRVPFRWDDGLADI